MTNRSRPDRFKPTGELTENQVLEVKRLVAKIAPILKGRHPAVQGATLADLLATWVLGHRDLDSRANTDTIREDMLATLVDFVRHLVAIDNR